MSDANSTLPRDQDTESLGARFAAAREARNLPVEQVAHETRIRAQRIREIENDDLSHFTHPSYARMYLTDYAKYLSIPVAEIKHLLPAIGAVGCEGYQYLQEGFAEAPAFPRVGGRSILPRRIVRTLIISASVLVVLFIAVVSITLIRNLERISHSTVAQTQTEKTDAVAPAAVAAPAPIKEVVPAAPVAAPTQTSTTSPEMSDQMFASGVIDHGSAVQ